MSLALQGDDGHRIGSICFHDAGDSFNIHGKCWSRHGVKVFLARFVSIFRLIDGRKNNPGLVLLKPFPDPSNTLPALSKLELRGHRSKKGAQSPKDWARKSSAGHR